VTVELFYLISMNVQLFIKYIYRRCDRAFVTPVNLFGQGRTDGCVAYGGRTGGQSHNRAEHDCGLLSLSLHVAIDLSHR